MNAFIQACLDANKEIYEYINTHISKSDYNYSNTIGVGGDNSLNIDLICEDIFIKHLLPFGSIYSEEKGHIESSLNNKIIIDPLDGSANFQTGLAYYGTSVAFEQNGEVIYSVICNLANHSVIYKVENEDVVEVDLISNLKISNFREYSSEVAIFERAYAYSDITKLLENYSIKFRSPGAVALSLAYAKNFKFVLFAGKIRDFDIKAALHICNDLYVFKNDEFLIVTKSNSTFKLIKEIIKE